MYRISKRVPERLVGSKERGKIVASVKQQALYKSRNNVWRSIADANKLWYRLAEKQLSLLGILPSEFRMLKFLSEQGSNPMVELARDQIVTRGAITGLADHLEHQGYITRVRSESDRRIINIEITKKGRKLLEKGTAVYQQFVEESLEDLSDEEINSLLRILNRMISSVQKHEK